MADPRTPEDLREDPVLCAEYPGKPITGLDERGGWRPLAAVARSGQQADRNHNHAAVSPQSAVDSSTAPVPVRILDSSSTALAKMRELPAR